MTWNNWIQELCWILLVRVYWNLLYFSGHINSSSLESRVCANNQFRKEPSNQIYIDPKSWSCSYPKNWNVKGHLSRVYFSFMNFDHKMLEFGLMLPLSNNSCLQATSVKGSLMRTVASTFLISILCRLAPLFKFRKVAYCLSRGFCFKVYELKFKTLNQVLILIKINSKLFLKLFHHKLYKYQNKITLRVQYHI